MNELHYTLSKITKSRFHIEFCSMVFSWQLLCEYGLLINFGNFLPFSVLIVSICSFIFVNHFVPSVLYKLNDNPQHHHHPQIGLSDMVKESDCNYLLFIFINLHLHVRTFLTIIYEVLQRCPGLHIVFLQM